MKTEKKNRDSKKKSGKSAKLQYGALCYRIRDNKVQFLLITTRGSGQWLIPKGWPMNGFSPSRAAAREAFEEAGVEGKMRNKTIGHFEHRASPGTGFTRRKVVVFPLKVKNTLKVFPEVGQRRRKWFGRKKAARKVENLGLSQLIRDFHPKGLGKL